METMTTLLICLLATMAHGSPIDSYIESIAYIFDRREEACTLCYPEFLPGAGIIGRPIAAAIGRRLSMSSASAGKVRLC